MYQYRLASGVDIGVEIDDVDALRRAQHHGLEAEPPADVDRGHA